MLREFANEEQNEMIDEALAGDDARGLAATWDDDEAWESFRAAMAD